MFVPNNQPPVQNTVQQPVESIPVQAPVVAPAPVVVESPVAQVPVQVAVAAPAPISPEPTKL